MIPKIIHYCWFGGGEIPDEYKRYIGEWKTLHPDWEFMLWNETNSPMDVAYMRSAKTAKNWANMSNFVRFFAVLNFGGIYLDTDMKVVKPLDSLLSNECFFGFESGSIEDTEFWVNNAVFGATPNHPFIQLCHDSILEKFDGLESANISAPQMVTKLLREEKGLLKYGLQELEGVKLYPVDFFYPIGYNDTFKLMDYKKYVTDNTFAVHMWGRSWMSKEMLLMFIDDLQRIAHTNKLHIKQLDISLTQADKEKAAIQEILKNTEQVNLNHVYDKNILAQQIETLKEKIVNANHAIDFKTTELEILQCRLTLVNDDFFERQKAFENQIQFLTENLQIMTDTSKLVALEYQSRIELVNENSSTILEAKELLILEVDKLIKVKEDLISDLEAAVHLKVSYFNDQKKVLESKNIEDKQKMNSQLEEKNKRIRFLEEMVEKCKKSPLNKLKNFVKNNYKSTNG